MRVPTVSPEVHVCRNYTPKARPGRKRPMPVGVQSGSRGGVANSGPRRSHMSRLSIARADYQYRWVILALVLLAIVSTAFLPRQGETQKSAIEQQIQNVQRKCELVLRFLRLAAIAATEDKQLVVSGVDGSSLVGLEE